MSDTPGLKIFEVLEILDRDNRGTGILYVSVYEVADHRRRHHYYGGQLATGLNVVAVTYVGSGRGSGGSHTPAYAEIVDAALTKKMAAIREPGAYELASVAADLSALEIQMIVAPAAAE